MTTSYSFSRLSLCAVLLVSLAACGGGGGGTNPSAISQPTSSVAIVTTVPPLPNYTGEELTAYNALNSARSTCGFGYIQQNTNIDTASRNHIGWMVDNLAYQHVETAGTTGFTGVNPWDRLTVAGYTWNEVGEIFDGLYSLNKFGFGALGITNLLGAPYHLAGAMGSYRELGIGVRSGGPIGSGADFTFAGTASETYIVVDMAASGNLLKQVQTASDVLTYPCQGISGTAWRLLGETPSPIPTRNLALAPVGQPIFVQVLDGNVLTIATAAVTGPLGTVALLPTMTSTSDPNSELKASQAIILPNVPLTPNTSYSVTIAGTNNGVAFTKNFTFNTGN